MNNTKFLHIRAAASGVAAGIFTAYYTMEAWSSIVFWAIVALMLGIIMHSRKELWTSVTFGIFLTFSFLLFVFGGTWDKLPLYLLFCLGMCVVGIIGSLAMMFLGRLIRINFGE